MSRIEAHNSIPLSTLREAYLPPTSPPPPYSLTLETSSTLPRHVFTCCFALVRDTMKDMYKRTIGWSTASKKKEMLHPDMRFLVISCGNATVGFLSFMITEEAGEVVIYCYELHLTEAARNKRLGSMLVCVMEGFGRNVGVRKAMLTVFVENEGGRRFYERLGYVKDESSPEEEEEEEVVGKVKSVAYMILSKGL